MQSKDMDNSLRRLKQELISMREAGDGLQAQMNSMMGALQELKLLQVQTALEQLQISCKTAQCSQHLVQDSTTMDTLCIDQLEFFKEGARRDDTQGSDRSKNCAFTREPSRLDLKMEPSLLLTSSPLENQRVGPRLVAWRPEPKGTHHRGSLCTSTSLSSTDEDSFSSHESQGGSPSWDTTCRTGSRSNFEERHPPFHPATMAELQGLMDTLSREGPSIDSDFSHCDTDDSSDWTSSLMSHSRNRQPLVLGDNVLADLVGNWLNLPELECRVVKEEEEERAARFSEVSDRPLRLSCSQEFCRRLSLTTNIFKKVLRSVRPDRDKLLKERPGWLASEDEEEEELFKRAKKKKTSKGSKLKGSFYRPFWAKAGGLRGKSRTRSDNVGKPIFDYNSAVWV